MTEAINHEDLYLRRWSDWRSDGGATGTRGRRRELYRTWRSSGRDARTRRAFADGWRGTQRAGTVYVRPPRTRRARLRDRDAQGALISRRRRVDATAARQTHCNRHRRQWNPLLVFLSA